MIEYKCFKCGRMYEFKEALPRGNSEAHRCIPGIGKCGGMLIKMTVNRFNKRLPSAGRWEDSQQGMRAARDDWANKNRGMATQ